ncbi:hypothetical protein Tco_0401215 [Tanacetum coccineum]
MKKQESNSKTEEFLFDAAAAILMKMDEVNANCILMLTRQPIPDTPPKKQQNDSNVISDSRRVGIVGGNQLDQHLQQLGLTCSFESLYNNLALEVEKVNSVNRKLKETKSADLTT